MCTGRSAGERPPLVACSHILTRQNHFTNNGPTYVVQLTSQILQLGHKITLGLSAQHVCSKLSHFYYSHHKVTKTFGERESHSISRF